VLSRFISADTVTAGGSQGLNRYAYVGNSPVNNTDPTGHMPIEGCGDEGKDSCSPTQQDIADYEYWRQRENALKCQAGNDDYCSYAEKHPVEYVTSAVVMLGGVAVIPKAGAIADAVGWKAAAACAMSSVCWTVTGAGGVAATQKIPLLQSGGSNNPRIGPVISRVTTDPSTFYRYWNTDFGNETGSWVTTLETQSSAAAADNGCQCLIRQMPFRE